MNQREALLRAVLVDPADDLPRLVYADWLEENGEAERAGFIRCHIEEGRLRHTHRSGSGGCRKCRLARRVCRWIESDNGGKAVFRDTFECRVGMVRYGGRSLIADPADGRSNEVEFTSGMVGRVRCTLAEWERHGARIVASDPVWWVTLIGRGEDWLWPRVVFQPRCTFTNSAWASFGTRWDAEEALSLACLNHHRERLGLPLLTALGSPAPEAQAVTS